MVGDSSADSPTDANERPTTSFDPDGSRPPFRRSALSGDHVVGNRPKLGPDRSCTEATREDEGDSEEPEEALGHPLCAFGGKEGKRRPEL